jgi:hypothetical protein
MFTYASGGFAIAKVGIHQNGRVLHKLHYSTYILYSSECYRVLLIAEQATERITAEFV